MSSYLVVAVTGGTVARRRDRIRTAANRSTRRGGQGGFVLERGRDGPNVGLRTHSPMEVRYKRAVAPTAIGRYEVLRVLGAGGFATVYLAHDDRLDANVAVKVLAENWSQDPDIIRRFMDEARLLRRCDDDRVVRVHTIEQLDDGRPYIVMDYADQGTLADRMFARFHQGQVFAVEEALRLSVELAKCLTVVHQCGVVHRDLKPSNVLFKSVRGDGSENMMVGDFGLARQLLMGSGMTITAGTPDYVAPEQADPALASSVDQRADVYAAAVILYQLLVGSVPFEYSSLREAATPRGDMPDLLVARPDLSPQVALVIEQGMARHPDDRIPTILAWFDALRAVSAFVAPPPDGAWPISEAPTVLGEAIPTPAPAPRPVERQPSEAWPPPPLPGPVGAPIAAAGAMASEARWAEPPAAPALPPPPARAPAPTSTEGGSTKGGSTNWWIAIAAIVAVVVLVAVVLGVLHRRAKAAASSSSTVTTGTVALSGTNSGVTAWFARVSGTGCAPASASERPTGATDSLVCTAGSITTVYSQMASPQAAAGYLAALESAHRDAVLRTWQGAQAGAAGMALFYNTDHGPAVTWTYTNAPYLATAVGGTRIGLDAWWAASGRNLQPGAA